MSEDDPAGPAATPPAPGGAILAQSVLAALKALRGGHSLRSNPLIQLEAITLSLRDLGIRDAPESREWRLGALLGERIDAELNRLRGEAPAPTRARDPVAAAIARARADFARGDPDLEAWSILQARFLSEAHLTVHRWAQELGVVRRTIERRTHRGSEALALALREGEIEARLALARMPGAPLEDRLRVEADLPVPQAAQSGQGPSLALDTGHLRPRAKAPPGAGAEPRRAFHEVLALVRSDDLTLRLDRVQVHALLTSELSDLDAYRVARIVEWSQPRFRLDRRFVDLSLLVDRGEGAGDGRWRMEMRRFDRLEEVLATLPEPALVLLGPPGAGKSTLLRHLELRHCAESLRGEHDRVTAFVPLNHYRNPLGGDPPEPGAWLLDRWRVRYPSLPGLDRLLAEGRVTLLLDALNEMPHADAADYRRKVLAWKQFLHETALARPGNRIVFSCRSLDYSAPLSTPTLRVPQVCIEPLNDAQARRFLQLYSPARAERIWRELEDTEQLDLLRSPYFLSLLVRYVESENRIPIGRAGLFTGFVRQALRREIERDNRLFAPNGLLTERDCRAVVAGARSAGAYALPEEGSLFRGLARLAFEMERREGAGRDAQVRIDQRDALALVADPQAEQILAAGLALAVLDEPFSGQGLTFFHQLLQEYFAGRRLAAAPEPTLLAAAWKAESITPGLAELLPALPPGEPLPPLPATGWEETALLAAPMARDPLRFVTDLAVHNLPLAGHCALQPELREVLDEASRESLRWALVARSRDPEADLRARIDAARALGRLADPRFERHRGPDGEALIPPLIEIPAGRYPIGNPEAAAGDALAPRKLRVEAFQLACFPVTNAEWACFLRAGGYEDPRWWPGEAARAWQAGEGTAAGDREAYRELRRRWKDDPATYEAKRARGLIPDDIYEDWLARLRMSPEDFEAHLRERWPAGRRRAPEQWTDSRFNHPAQPVVGVSWYEARAYGLWLSDQTGRRFRLPTEIEWEAAARGPAGRRFAFGEHFDPLACNSAAVHLQAPSPVGVFPAGDTPEGLCDMTGNVHEWTASAFEGGDDPDWGPASGPAAAETRRVRRGHGWPDVPDNLPAFRRVAGFASSRTKDAGFRLACDG